MRFCQANKQDGHSPLPFDFVRSFVRSFVRVNRQIFEGYPPARRGWRGSLWICFDRPQPYLCFGQTWNGHLCYWLVIINFMCISTVQVVWLISFKSCFGPIQKMPQNMKMQVQGWDIVSAIIIHNFIWYRINKNISIFHDDNRLFFGAMLHISSQTDFFVLFWDDRSNKS